VKKTIGFIGCGNMGGALARCACTAVDPGSIWLCDADKKKSEEIASEFGACVADIDDVAENCSVIFLGVKPQMMEGMLYGIREKLASRKDAPLLVSMAAGLEIKTIKKMAGDFPVIRIMPNLAASVGEAAVLYCRGDADDSAVELFKEIMKNAGELIPIQEDKIDAASAISGCAPAFAAMFAEALADGGVSCGLSRDVAVRLAELTMKGTAEMLLREGIHPDELKDRVCSPGGTTIEGVLTLEEKGMRHAVAEAVRKAYRRTLELK